MSKTNKASQDENKPKTSKQRIVEKRKERYADSFSAFGKRMIELMEAKEPKPMSKYRLSKETGLDPKYVIQIERGEANPTLTTIFVLAECLGVSPSEFFE